MNEIYDDTIIKYTINIPKELYCKLARKTRKGSRYGGRKSVYIRELLERSLVDERPATMKEMVEMYQTGSVYEPPRRFSGFIDGLLRNSYRFAWFKKKMLDRT